MFGDALGAPRTNKSQCQQYIYKYDSVKDLKNYYSAIVTFLYNLLSRAGNLANQLSDQLRSELATKHRPRSQVGKAVLSRLAFPTRHASLLRFLTRFLCSEHLWT